MVKHTESPKALADEPIAAADARASLEAVLSAPPFALRFPTMLRMMWSGSDVQAWLDALPPLYTHPGVGAATLELSNEELFELAVECGMVTLDAGQKEWRQFANAILTRASAATHAATPKLSDADIDRIQEDYREEYGQLCDADDMREFGRRCTALAISRSGAAQVAEPSTVDADYGDLVLVPRSVLASACHIIRRAGYADNCVTLVKLHEASLGKSAQQQEEPSDQPVSLMDQVQHDMVFILNVLEDVNAAMSPMAPHRITVGKALDKARALLAASPVAQQQAEPAGGGMCEDCKWSARAGEGKCDGCAAAVSAQQSTELDSKDLTIWEEVAERSWTGVRTRVCICHIPTGVVVKQTHRERSAHRARAELLAELQRKLIDAPLLAKPGADDLVKRIRALYNSTTKDLSLGKPGMGVVKGGAFREFANGSAQSQVAMFTGAEHFADGERDANAAFYVGIHALIPQIVQTLSVQSGQRAGVAEDAIQVPVERLKEWLAAFSEEMAAYDIDPPIYHLAEGARQIQEILDAAAKQWVSNA